MSDPVHRANERGLLVEPQLTSGFDVNAAAAEVRAELAPGQAPAPQRWTAEDYGWDPADANAVAWAAYYSDLGVDPDALAAQQAAEAAAQAAPAAVDAPSPEAAPGATAAPLAAEDDVPNLDELTFAPVSTEDPGAVAAPDDLAPGALDGGSAMWELLPSDPSPTAAPSAEPQLQHGLPAEFSGDDRTRIDDFQLAGGGSFDEATAPIGDPSEVAAYEPADDVAGFSPVLPPLDVGLDGEERPGATAAIPAESVAPADLLPPDPPEPLSLLDLDVAAPGAEVSIDLGFVEDEAVVDVPATPAEGQLAPLPFHADLEPSPAPIPAAAPAPSARQPDAALDLDWSAHAVPEGDAAIDFASFDAEPQLDAGPVSEGTAMWGLPGRAPAPTRPAAAAVLGDAAPLPTPASALAADLGEPIDGSLFLEPVHDGAEEPAAAPQSRDPWDAAAPPAPPPDLALEAGGGPFDLGAVDAPAAVESSDAILEVGEEVVELPASEPPASDELSVAPAFTPPPPDPAPAPAQDPEPPAPPEPLAGTEEPLPGAEPFAALADEPAPPKAVATPSCFIAGTHRVVVHTADGQVKRGTLRDAALDGPDLQLLPQAGNSPELLPTERVKAIFFMLGAGEPPPPPEGKKVRVTFRDGRQVAGFSPDYAPERVGFFMVPADTRTHTARIWVYRASVRQVTVSP